MSRKKQKKVFKQKKSKKNTKLIKKKQTKRKMVKTKEGIEDEPGVLIIDKDLKIYRASEVEERKAYLEEARSQEAFD